jgi:hypothetical protein
MARKCRGDSEPDVTAARYIDEEDAASAKNRQGQFHAVLVAHLLTSAGLDAAAATAAPAHPAPAPGTSVASSGLVSFQRLVGLAETPEASVAEAAAAPYYAHAAHAGIAVDFQAGNLVWLDASNAVQVGCGT